MEDDIARGFAGWHTDRHSLDTDTLAQTARVVRLGRHFELARREVLAARHLETWEYDVLESLATAGAPRELSPGALTLATQVTSGTMTNRIDKLSRRGYVTREPDPDDRRGVLVRLSVSGRKKVEAAGADIAEAEAAIWQQLGVRRREQLAVTLGELLATFDQ